MGKIIDSDLTVTGAISGSVLYGDGSNLTNVAAGGVTFTPSFPVNLDGQDNLELLYNSDTLTTVNMEGDTGSANISGGLSGGIVGNSVVNGTLPTTDHVWRVYDNSFQYTGWTPGYNYDVEFTADEKSDTSDKIIIYITKNFSYENGTNTRAQIPVADRLLIYLHDSYNGGVVLRYIYNQSSGGDNLGYKPWSAGQRVKISITPEGVMVFSLDGILQFTTQLTEDYHDVLFTLDSTSDINFSDFQWGTAGGSGLSLADSGVTKGTYSYSNITVDDKGRLTSASDGTTPLLPSNNLSDVSNTTTALSNLGGVTQSSLDTKLDTSVFASLSGGTDLSNYYTKAEVDSAIDDISGGGGGGSFSLDVQEYNSSLGDTSIASNVNVFILSMSGAGDIDLDMSATANYSNSVKIKRLGLGTGDITITPDGIEQIDDVAGVFDASSSLANKGDLLELIPYSKGFILG
jgi:hypothetical protein